jgi:bifunctional non-homologous end joining protein LigD
MRQQQITMKFGRLSVPVTHLDKLYWPAEGVTKGMVIDYYQSITSYLLPFMKNRPQSLLRNPNGILDRGFYHKDAGKEAPDWIKTCPVPSESSHKIIDYIVCNNRATLAYLNNLGCIELNPWHSTIAKPDHPDYLIIDLDPSRKNHFDEVVEVAQAYRHLLAQAGVDCFCKTSGASGLHIYVPAGKKYEYADIRAFAHQLSLRVNSMLPALTTLERPLNKRGKKIYLDYLQNSKGQTIAGVFCLRPRPGATVSMPLYWRELKPGLDPASFHIRNAVPRIKRMAPVFAGVLGKGIDLQKVSKKLSL